MEVCRSCFAYDSDLLPIDELFVMAYNDLTRLDINLSDGLPQNVCPKCSEAVKYCIDFRDRCIATEFSMKNTWFKKETDDDTIETYDETIDMENQIKAQKTEVSGESNDHESIMECMQNDNKEDSDNVVLFIVKAEKEKKRLKSHRKKRIKIMKRHKLAAYACGICEEKGFSKSELAAHVELHKDLKWCPVCSGSATLWPHLVGHRLNHIQKKHWLCHVCQSPMKSSFDMEFHYMTNHYQNYDEDSELKCKYCDELFKTKLSLHKHFCNVHNKTEYICEHCSKRFSNKVTLIAHMTTHNNVRVFVCDICGFTCKLQCGLKQHMTWKHSATKNYCTKCNKVLTDQEQLEKHECLKKYKICPVCGKQVYSRYKKHLESHEVRGKYECDRCDASYRTKGGLRAHYDRHDGNRQFKCEFCPLKFYTASTLTKHRRVHTGERPYVCEICSKSFTGSSNLKIHMKVHGMNLTVKRVNPKDNPFVTSGLAEETNKVK